jgi:hypothetical protein
MLSAEAVRLAALEVLCPTAALAGDEDFPTLAGAKVFDSRLPGIDDLDRDAKFTPVLALFSTDSTVQPRGPAADMGDTDPRAVLEIVAELAVAARDEDGTFFADAMAADDWDARLVLAALVAQVRRLLAYDERGRLFRRFVRQVERVTEETFAIPQLGARWHRVTMRFELSVPDDEFDDAAGLPEPLRTLAGLLPAGSPAAERLATLAAHFATVARAPLEEVHFTEASGAAGLVAETEQT